VGRKGEKRIEGKGNLGSGERAPVTARNATETAASSFAPHQNFHPQHNAHTPSA